MRRLTTPIILLAAAAAVAVAGCGGSSSSSGKSDSASGSAAPASAYSSPAKTTTKAAAATPASADSGKSTEVRLQSISFSPKAIKVKAGQEVEWENYDSVSHNVTATSGASFKSATLAKGAKFTFVPRQAGTIQYVCTFHPGMAGTITVSQ